MEKITDTVILCDPKKLQDEIEKNIEQYLNAHIEKLNKKMDKFMDERRQNSLERDAEIERHAQQVESFLGSIEKVLKAKL